MSLDVMTIVYTFDMAQRAKLFSNGGSQAVRLPKSVRFPDSQHEVIVRRSGKKVILEPADEWPKEFLDILGSYPDEIERPTQQPISKKRNPFD
jgi:antitoxin VapB